MEWMGRLPMLAHPDPQQALVICFGTGRTANAVREEGPAQLDIAEISPAVFGMAQHFEMNRGVLDDPRVRNALLTDPAVSASPTLVFYVLVRQARLEHVEGVDRVEIPTPAQVLDDQAGGVEALVGGDGERSATGGLRQHCM